MDKKIGVFDSGYGGLTILDGIIKKMPNYSYIYLGDNFRAPYGGLTQEQVFNYTCQAINFLFKKNCNIVIIACNTVSAKALRKIQHKYIDINSDKRVLGVVVPLLEEVEELAVNEDNKVGVLGTKATINSKVFQKEIKKRLRKVKVFSKSCPLLVPMIELGQIETKKINETLKKYTNNLVKKNLNILVLGCTHFHYLEKEVKRIFSNKVKIIKTPEIVALKLKKYLDSHQEIKKKISTVSSLAFFTTGDEKNFEEFYKNNFGKSIRVKKIKLFSGTGI